MFADLYWPPSSPSLFLSSLFFVGREPESPCSIGIFVLCYPAFSIFLGVFFSFQLCKVKLRDGWDGCCMSTNNKPNIEHGAIVFSTNSVFFFVEAFRLFHFSRLSVANGWKIVGPSSHPKPSGRPLGPSRREKKRNNSFFNLHKKRRRRASKHTQTTHRQLIASSECVFVCLCGLPSHRHWTQLISCFPTFFYFLTLVDNNLLLKIREKTSYFSIWGIHSKPPEYPHSTLCWYASFSSFEF